jgi:hypothetical protein
MRENENMRHQTTIAPVLMVLLAALFLLTAPPLQAQDTAAPEVAEEVVDGEAAEEAVAEEAARRRPRPRPRWRPIRCRRASTSRWTGSSPSRRAGSST